MADNYISTNMESGVKVKEALERIESYEPGLFVWTEVSDSVTVNLKSPTTYSGIKDPGDYVIYKFSNGPAKIPSTLAPVLLSLRNGEICVTANNMVFMLNGDNWVDMSESTDTDTTIFVKSDIAPVRTKNCYWFDTSKYATEGYITLKYYDTDTSTWTSVFNEERYLKKSELDPDNKNTDVYDYITAKVAGVVGEYGEFMKHVANQLTYIHVSADDRKAYGKIITKDQLQTLLEKTYTPAVTTVIDQTVSDGLGTTALENSLTTLKDNITSHLEGHVTAEDITRWKNKAEKNHTHDYTQGNTKLDASQIVSGTFGADQLPDEIEERYYKITAASPAAEFSRSSITAAVRKGKYHNSLSGDYGFGSTRKEARLNADRKFINTVNKYSKRGDTRYETKKIQNLRNKIEKIDAKSDKKASKAINKAIKKQTSVAEAWEKEGNARYAKANRYVADSLSNELKNVRMSEIKTRKDVDQFVTDKIAVYLSTTKK